MDKQAKTLQELVKLDYDAIEAYEEAIQRLEDSAHKSKLEEFRQDHVRHTENLGEILRKMNQEVPTGPDMKRMLTEGKVKIGSLGGDKAILRAMNANEKVTNETYEKALKLDNLDTHTRQTLEQNLADEQRHKAWIEQRIEALKHAA